MSRENLSQTCDACREEAYDYRAGRLSSPERERIEEHLEDCEPCRDYFERVDTLLRAAAEADPAPGEADSDEMFDAITDRIQEREEEAPSSPDEETEASSEIPQVSPSSNWRRHVGVAAAALVAGLLLGWILTGILAGDQSSTPVAERSDGGAERGSGTRVAETDAGGADEASSEDRGFADLREIPAELGGSESGGTDSADGASAGAGELSMFASSGAEWSLDRNGETVIDLERGRLLVEFVGGSTRELTVRTPDCEVRVVGTIFFVSADREGPRAGVLAGEIEVEPEAGENVRLRDGQEAGAEFEPRAMPDARRKSLQKYVDLEAHRRKLEASAAEERDESDAEEDRDRTAARESPESGRSEDEVGDSARPGVETGGGTEGARGAKQGGGELESLRERADRAASTGNDSRAAALYRDYLDRAPDGHPGIGPVHLDLANLYIRRLDAPARAVPHLKTYVRQWPDDVATPSAREELCRITRKLDEFEPQCD